jgi:hypothetical protein
VTRSDLAPSLSNDSERENRQLTWRPGDNTQLTAREIRCGLCGRVLPARDWFRTCRGMDYWLGTHARHNVIVNEDASCAYVCD